MYIRYYWLIGRHNAGQTGGKKMTIYTVLLKDGTVGKIDDSTLDGQHPDAFIGEIVLVKLQDENGNPIEVRGELVEVLQ